MTHTIGICNGAGIIRDLRHGDTGEIYDCPGCPSCRRELDEDDDPWVEDDDEDGAPA